MDIRTASGRVGSLLKGFQSFIMRGNAVDLAVGVVIGASFGGVVTALVKDLLTPLIAAIFKQPDFSGLYFTLNGSKFMYGDLFNVLISFLLTAAAVYFFVVLPLNTFLNRMKKSAPAPEKTKICPECRSTIDSAAKRCAYCTSVIA
jgi:large conductance mechanosensitive channel